MVALSGDAFGGFFFCGSGWVVVFLFAFFVVLVALMFPVMSSAVTLYSGFLPATNISGLSLE
jgi:hypothetical protein